MTYFQTHIMTYKTVAYSNNAFSCRCGFLRQAAFLVPANLRYQELPRRSSRLSNMPISVEHILECMIQQPADTAVSFKKCRVLHVMCMFPLASSMQRTTTSQNQARSAESLPNFAHLGDDTTLSRQSFCSRTPCRLHDRNFYDMTHGPPHALTMRSHGFLD